MCENLEELSLSLEDVSDVKVKLEKLKPLEKMKKLQKLRIMYSGYLDSSQIPQSFSHLQVLIIEHDISFSDTSNLVNCKELVKHLGIIRSKELIKKRFTVDS